MRRIFDNSVLVGVGLIVALLLLFPALAYRNTRQLNVDAQRIAHTYEVLALAGEVLTVLVNAETGVRGFVITGKDVFLQSYDGISRLDGLMAKLREKTKENSDQQARITKLEELVTVRLGQFKEAIALRREDEKAAQAFVLTGKPKAQMDAIRQHVADMEKVENELLKERQSKTATTYRVAVTTGLLTGVLGLVTVGAFVWLLRRSLSARQKAAALLYEQRERFRLTLSSIGDGVVVTDTEGKVTFLNAVAQSLTGWTEDEARGRPLETIFKIVNQEGRKTVENPALRALKEGRIVGLANHTILISKTGQDCPIDDSAAPIRNEEGDITGAVLVFRDITERHHLEQQKARWLADARLLASIVDSSNDAIIGKSLDGIVQSWNAAAERLFGYTAEQAVGRHISFLIPADRADEEARIIARLRTGERVETFDTVRVRNNGQPIHVSLTISPVKDDEGRIVGASMIVRDNTERTQAGEALRLLNDELETRVQERTANLEIAMAKLRKEVSERRRLEDEILQITEHEQRRIGQDLHDDLGQQLVGITMLSQLLAGKLSAQSHPSAADAAKLKASLSESITTTRNLAKTYYPVELERGGLILALKDLAHRTELLAKVGCSVRADDGFHFDKASEIHLYRIVQESIGNAIKHGHARNIAIDCTVREGASTLTVTDDGGGFKPPEAGKWEGMGLHLFQYRARLIGAEITVTRGENGGCKVSCSMGVQNDRADRGV